MTILDLLTPFHYSPIYYCIYFNFTISLFYIYKILRLSLFLLKLCILYFFYNSKTLDNNVIIELFRLVLVSYYHRINEILYIISKEKTYENIIKTTKILPIS